MRAEDAGRDPPVTVRPVTREHVEARLRLAESNLDRTLGWVSRYDGKTGPILAVDTAMLGYLATVAPPPSQWSLPFGALVLACVATLAASMWFLYAGSYPRTTAPRRSLVFFGTIGTMPRDEFAREFRDRSVEEHLEDVLTQSHRVSELLALKFRCLQRAFALLLASIPTWTLAILLVLTPA